MTASRHGPIPTDPAGGGLLYHLGRASARHAGWTITVWLVVLVAASLGHRAVGSAYSDNFTVPGSPSQQAADLLARHEPSAGGQNGLIVFAVTGGTAAAHRSEIDAALGEVRTVPHVLSVGATRTSSDGRTTYAPVNFDTTTGRLGAVTVRRVDGAVAPVRAAGVQVEYGGVLGQAARPSKGDARSELIGIVVAVLVLLVGFGSVYAAALPILAAIVGVGTGIGLLGILAAATTFATVAPTLGIMMGLGVGIDYALFQITRHRQMVMDGADPVDAAARTVSTSGRAVLTAAVTVILALLGLYASGIGFIGKLGLAAALTVLVAALAALTVVPALLGIAGRRIDRFFVRRPVAESGAAPRTGSGARPDAARSETGRGSDTGRASDTERGGGTAWHRYAERVGRHPWMFLGAGIAVLAVLAVPLLSMRLGHIDAGADPRSYTDRRAYDLVSDAFGPGTNGPFTIVVRLPAGTTAAARQGIATDVETALRRTAGVATASVPRPTSDGALLVATAIPRTGPQDAATATLLTTLRDQSLPHALAGTGATGYVTGSTPGQLDFRDKVAGRLPVIIAVVVAAAFALLLATFRSPFLAAKAAVLNLLSIGAAYGIIVAVFQWGWGGPALGVSEKVPVESYIPMMMFAIVFGLSMDYEVFLLSRIRESWLLHHDNHRSVAEGLSATARVISCAALIMTSVFLSFLLSTNVTVKIIALGLGASVLVDATVIRLVVVPATMFLAAGINWWCPRWLDAVLPHLDPDT